MLIIICFYLIYEEIQTYFVVIIRSEVNKK
jgi:hypothetical protein